MTDLKDSSPYSFFICSTSEASSVSVTPAPSFWASSRRSSSSTISFTSSFYSSASSSPVWPWSAGTSLFKASLNPEAVIERWLALIRTSFESSLPELHADRLRRRRTAKARTRFFLERVFIAIGNTAQWGNLEIISPLKKLFQYISGSLDRLLVLRHERDELPFGHDPVAFGLFFGHRERLLNDGFGRRTPLGMLERKIKSRALLRKLPCLEPLQHDPELGRSHEVFNEHWDRAVPVLELFGHGV